jgi:iron complex outermembrane receptor protein
MNCPPFLSLVLILCVALPREACAQIARATSGTQLKKLSLEELLALEVTSVSRRAEPASQAAAAVEVITHDQITRTGAASIQDVLRLAPGVQVSGFGGHSFAISTRGFASLAANKLQVMQDGRSLYSPLFTGVFWDAYGVMLEDIDRIEVIRGPGATMWGANAVNGVISILTKDARDTQGSLLAAGGGSYERSFATIRHGGTAGANTHYRVYARTHNRDAMALPSGQDTMASPRETQAGFRLDSRPREAGHIMVQGDYFQNEAETGSNEHSSNRNINLLSRWTKQLNPDTELQLRAYFDRFERTVPRQMGDRRNTFDVDAQYRVRFAGNHNLVTGFNYRLSSDHTDSGGTTQFLPRGRIVELASAFIQDEITIVPAHLAIVIGSKFQWDSLYGMEPQPSVRVAWTPDQLHTVWAAISRAVRMPTRIDEDLRFLPLPSSGVVAFQGNPRFKPEKLNAFELGYRVRATSRLFLDVTGFHHEYRQLRSLEPTPPLGIPFVQYNLLDAETSGVEVSVKYEPASWWRLSGNYSYLKRRMQPRPASRDSGRGVLEGNDAPRLFSIWSSMDLTLRTSLDLIVRHVGALPQPFIPSYTELDVRFAWRPTDSVELALVGQNLLDHQHLEFGTASPATAEIERSFYGKVTWRF